MSADALGAAIVGLAGGAGNVRAVSHCWSRLRLDLVDPAAADRAGLAALADVLLVVDAGGELQVALRTGLLETHAAVAALLADAR